MNENLKLLTEALRSGEYKQGKNKLSADDTHCCLGVACEVYQKHVGGLNIETREVEMPEIEHANCKSYKSYDKSVYALPDKVRKWYGFSTEVGSLKASKALSEKLSAALGRPDPGLCYLTDANDAGIPFTIIADIIDEGSVETEEDVAHYHESKS